VSKGHLASTLDASVPCQHPIAQYRIGQD
jgi:hypothetical protein